MTRQWLRAAGAGRQRTPAALIGRGSRPLNFTVRPPEIVLRESTLCGSHVPSKVGAPGRSLCFRFCVHVVEGKREGQPGYLILSAALAVMAVVFVVMFKRRMWNLADDVLDGGTYLLVRFGAREASINLSDITNVEAEQVRGDDGFDLRRLASSAPWYRSSRNLRRATPLPSTESQKTSLAGLAGGLTIVGGDREA